MDNHDKIHYIEMMASDLESTKSFFRRVFGWDFQDYGPDYCSFLNAGLDGGFHRADLKADTANGSALVVLYSSNLEETRQNVTDSGGLIKKDIFSFPGGRRFHFTEPSGNEFAVWSDQGMDQ